MRHRKKKKSKKTNSALPRSAIVIAAAVAIAVGLLFFYANTQPNLVDSSFPPVDNTYNMASLLKQLNIADRREIGKLKAQELEAIRTKDEFVSCAINANYGAKFNELAMKYPKKADKLKKLGSEYFAGQIYSRGAAMPNCDYSAHNLATWYRERGETNRAWEWYNVTFQRSRSLHSASNRFYPSRLPRLDVPGWRTFTAGDIATKVSMDFHWKQMNTLIQEGRIPRSYLAEAKAAKKFAKKIPPKDYVRLTPDMLKKFPSYRRAYYVAHQQRLPGSTVRARADVKEIEERYHSHSVVIVDDFLTTEAITRLHEFASRSAIYTDSKPRGYVGSYWEDGFVTPLLAQVTEDIAKTFPDIFKDYPLKNSWAYNYDDQYQQGIKLHGDQAAVNCNLWITPDEANLDPSNGGLVVYTNPVPLDWSFEDYNVRKSNRDDPDPEFKSRIRKLIKDSEKIVAPYRHNRIVIFKSDLMHNTDHLKFKPGFKKRRINLTFLYGDRGQGEDPMTIKQRAEHSHKMKRKQIEKKKEKKRQKKKEKSKLYSL